MSSSFEDEYFEKLYRASKKAFTKLFENNEHFYYCTLTITGDGLTPVISAWSYADSPYYAWEYDSFQEVTELLECRPKALDMSDYEWEKEFNIRVEGMVKVMTKLDKDGIFSKSQERSAIVVLAEVMPPDESNTERAFRLNKSQTVIFKKWLKEAAE